MPLFQQEVPERFLSGDRCLVGRIKGVERPPLAPLIPTEKGVSTSDRLWGECRCKTVSSGAVCQDGFDLYGTCDRSQESEGCDREYRSRRRKGQCAGQGDISAC